MANKGEPRSGQGRDEINLSNIRVNVYDSLSNKDEHDHTYDDIADHSANISATKVSDSNGQTANTKDTTLKTEVTVTRRMIVLAVMGSVLLSTMISVIAGITVYHVTITTMADSGKQPQDQTDALTLTVKQLKNNLTAASGEWNEEMMSLKANVSELERKLTAASGEWNEESARHYSKDCSELFATGTVEDGVYTISPDGRCPFQVYCDMTGGGWTLIQKRIDGLVSFYRTWQEYAEGFGNIDGEHWLGLDKTHRVTADGSEIYFHFEYLDDTIGFSYYQMFSVHGAITTYRMNVDAFGYNGTVQELLSYHNNMKFTTYDRDNDAHSGINCAKRFDGSGWWYNSCYSLGNLNGVYGKHNEGGIAYNIGHNVFLKSVIIKVKPSPGYC